MTQPSGQAPERVAVGIIGKAHGLDGSVYVVQPNPDLLVKGAQVFLDGDDEARTITRRAGTAARPILRLSGAENRNDADALRGRGLSVGIENAPDLEDDEYWAHQLVGCTVHGQVAGEVLGEALELLAYPSCELLRVGGGQRGELLVPLVKDAIVEIDVEGRRILVDDEFLALDD